MSLSQRYALKIANYQTSSSCLIVNADDFGKTQAVNQAIVEASARGILTSTTVMVNMPYAEEISGLISAFPKVGIGLHVNLTSGYPVLPPESIWSLVDKTGHFWDIDEFLRRVWFGRIKREHIRSEIDAQLSKLIKLVGKVTHLDSHKHIHGRNLQVLDEMLQVGKAHGVIHMRTNRRYFVNSKSEQKSQLQLRLQHFAKSPLGIAALGLTTIQTLKFRRFQFISPDYVLTPFPSVPTASLDLSINMLTCVFKQTPTGVFEMIFHPGGGTKYDGQKELLCHPKIGEIIQELNISLVNFGDLEARS
ncbi:hopanoid biosynthesis associated protein HpnK [Calothrix sp. NIES-2100]|uniref:carbohydrate deacetylase n=1 Tax=Calothrix sp. NIES-2100 TaxID=1954172 RepID=UPI000B5F9971|nr:hopanoid biosynthesis associated protein HpnK [Calothrix sp. NIES-2100]